MRPQRTFAIVLAVLALLVSSPVPARQPPDEGSFRGLTPDQVRAKMGRPERVQRVAVQGLLVEHWTYQGTAQSQVVVFHVRAGTNRPTVQASYSLP